MPSTTSKTKPRHSWRFEALGTQWQVETRLPLAADVKARITARIEVFDKTYSRFRDDSLVAKLAAAAGTYEFPEDARELVAFYELLYKATDGAVSPLVGNVLEQAGYDKAYSLKPGDIEPALAWDDVMTWDGRRVKTTRPLTLDFGAAGKGYLNDIAGKLLEDAGHGEYVVDASGDVRVRGKGEVIGLENPHDPASVIGVAKVANASICASAINRRTWADDWHHVVDPRTGRPVNDVVATWAIAETTMIADGLATALFFVSADKLTAWDFEYVRLYANGSIERSADFVGELYV